MTRINPWVLWPVIAALAIGAVIGWIVTDLSCRPATCYGTATAVATIAALISAVGVGVVSVLAIRSFAEWRRAVNSGGPLPAPGCETGEDGDHAPGPGQGGGTDDQ